MIKDLLAYILLFSFHYYFASQSSILYENTVHTQFYPPNNTYIELILLLFDIDY